MREKFAKFVRQTSVKSLAIYLVIATVLSICVTFSKYIVGSTGADGARMIKMGELFLKEDNDDGVNGQYTVTPGRDIKKIPTVTFTGSEADCYVFVSMKLGSAWEKNLTSSGTDYNFCVYRKDQANLDKTDANNIRMSFTVIKDTTTNGYGNSGWKFVKYDSSTSSYIFATHVEANNSITDRPFLETLTGATNDPTIDVSSAMTLEDITAIKNMTDGLDIKFLSVVMQDPGSGDASACWSRLNTQALTP